MDLTALQHSPFLQSLGWAIANSFWQAAVLWIAYVVVSSLYRNASAKFKNTSGTILISGIFVWFCITLLRKYFAVENAGDTVIRYYETDAISAASYNWDQFLERSALVLPYLSAAYLLLLVFLSFRLVNVYRYTHFIKVNGLLKPGAEWKTFTEKVALHMGISRKIRLWVSRHVDVPATIGFLKPVILIPLASINQLTADQMEAIILHELSHIKRNDYLINLFVSLVETILFFNPFVVLLAKVIKRERENCCDDFVIQYQYDRHAYASALLSLEQTRNVNLKLAIGATSGKKQLFLRIKRIMEINNNTNFNYGQKLAALVLITGIICSVAWVSAGKKENKKRQNAATGEVVLDKKVIDVEKPGTLLLTGVENKVKTIVLKPKPKKTVAKLPVMKDLKELSLQEIALNNYRRATQLLMESQKKVGRKRIDRLSLNKLWSTTGGGNTYLMDNANVNFKTILNNTEMQRFYTALDMQKLQSEMEKAQFAYTIECDKLQDAFYVAFGSSKPARSTPPVPQPNVRTRTTTTPVTEKVKTETQTAPGNIRRLLPEHFTSMSSGFSEKLGWDSFAIAEVKAAAHVRTPGSTTRNTVPVEFSSPYPMSYTFSFGNNDKETDKTKRSTPKAEDKSRAEGRSAPAVTVISGMRYKLSEAELERCKVLLSQVTVPETENVHVQFRNGIVYINGKEIIADKKGILNQVYLKAKKEAAKTKESEVNMNDD